MNFSIGWLQPGLLWLAAFAAAPVIVHLVSRIRPPERRFPTVEFLRRAMSRTFRWRRPQDWLLLALRTLAVAALALCFPQPVLVGGRNLTQSSEGKHLMLVVDRSASMAASGDGQSRFALAVARAVEILRSAGRVESLNLVWLDAQPDAVFPDMGRSRERLEEVLRAATVSGQRGDVPGALRLALERLEKLPGAKEMYVLSDLQATAWRETLPAAPKDVQVFKVKLGNEAPNLALSGLETQPVEPLPGENVQALARVKNFSPEARIATVVFSLGDARSTRQVEVQPWGEAQVGLNLPITEVGSFVVRATLQGSEDRFAMDDHRAIVRRAREGLKVGVLPTALAPEEREVWQRALGALPWANVQQGAVAELGSTCEILVAADSGEETTKAVQEVLRRGGTVLYRPLAAPWQLGPVGSGQPALTASLEKTPTDAPWHLRIANEKAEVFQLFSTGEFGDPARGLFHQRARLAGGADDLKGWDLTMAYSDGMPALARKKVDQGAVWWWNLPMAPGASTWSGESAFLPFLGEVILQSRPVTALPPGTEVQPGQSAAWSPARLLEGGKVQLMDQTDAAVPVQEDLQTGGQRYFTARPLEPGLYRWLVVQENQGGTGHVVAHTAVNVPEEEMDLRTLAPEAVPFGETLATGNAAALSFAQLRDGVPLWPWLLLTATAAFLLESLLLAWWGRGGRKDQTSNDKLQNPTASSFTA
ncbi:BatA domain-containing protein [Verrucomicrobium sp. BvORR106]|uniref:BatA domain-containing protein n=1 Tax=Verrucomicrobium sp. BvORR106 TaxID=1403819 RepID=UPI00056DCCD2|nr:BatA domain-containing protein [Verrucomicrobium sp. BvORR106]